MTGRRTLWIAVLLLAAITSPTAGPDRPFGSAGVFLGPPLERPELEGAAAGVAGSKQSKVLIEAFRCQSAGDPASAVDISCNDEAFGQSYSPDNEITVAVNPWDSDHVVAGSNDYFYRFNNSTGARQVIVPTGFFTSFDGGATWVDGQIPMQSGTGAGDPSVAFVRKLSDPTDAHQSVVLMAQLENTGGLGGPYVAQGDVSVSRSVDGGITWSEPITVMRGTGTGIGPANQAVFWDKEWITVDNTPGSPYYGRTYLTATRFLNGLQGSYAEGPIYLSWSDDGGVTWSSPREISGSHPSCTFQSTGPANECDEDQNSIPIVAPDGTVYVHFGNYQNEAEWEVENDFDSQIMVVKSTDGGHTFQPPVVVAQREDGASDMPFSVLSRQTIWGHQIRWSSDGNIAVDPTNPLHLTVIWSDRGTANPLATDACVEAPLEAPAYDPCNAGPGSVISVYRADSVDGGATWSPRTLVGNSANTAQWFPWGAYQSNGTLVIGWDEDLSISPADEFVHVLWKAPGTRQVLSPAPEQVDISLTHWSGQYVPESEWPTVCGPSGYSDGPVANAEGKDCNAFDGDYTGLAVGTDDSIHVVWTGFNRLTTSPQIDRYTGAVHDGYAQDAMYARR